MGMMGQPLGALSVTPAQAITGHMQVLPGLG